MEFFNFLIDSLSAYPFLVVLLGFLAITIMLPIPEELVLMTGGYLSFQLGGLNWLPTIIVGIIGVIITDMIPFILAKKYGYKILKRKLISDRILKFVNRYGALSAFVVRFIPGGVRNPTFLVCGLSGVRINKFFMAVSVGAIITSQISFWLGYFFSDKIDFFIYEIKVAGRGITALLIIVVSLYVIYKLYQKYKHRFFL